MNSSPDTSKKVSKSEQKVRKVNNLSIDADSRVLIVGKTGSGKTTLTQYLLFTAKRLIVIDAKDGLQEWGLENYSKSKHLPAIEKNEEVRIRVVSDHDTIEVLNVAYAHGNVLIYIDEITASIPPQTKPDQIYLDIWQRGRSRNIGAWGASQRPKAIPIFFLSEAEHFFIFRLNIEDDRKRVAGFAGKGVLVPPVDRYGFYYYNLYEDRLRYFKRLNIE